MSEDLSKEDMAFVGWLARNLRLSVVDALLAGNDTQCFTTEQYIQKYEEMNDKTFRCKKSPILTMKPSSARMHLEGLAEVLYEPQPDVWARY